MALFKKDDDGNVIDPPVLPDWEAKAEAARNSGDNDLIAHVQEGYEEARADEIQRLETAEKKRAAAERAQARKDAAADKDGGS